MRDRCAKFEYGCRGKTSDGRYATGAENILRMFYTGHSCLEQALVELSVKAWMTFDGHRENVSENTGSTKDRDVHRRVRGETVVYWLAEMENVFYYGIVTIASA